MLHPVWKGLRLLAASGSQRYSCRVYASTSTKDVEQPQPTRPLRDVPARLEIDGAEYVPDPAYWNLSPEIIRQLKERRLLEEPGSPLKLLSERIVKYFHANYRRAGGRSPLFAVCSKERRVVSTWENFDSLLTPADHVSRRPSDTYYLNATHCLRAHTSAHQHSLISAGHDAFLALGDVYRRDEIDRTHFPCFHQLEGVRLYSRDQLFGLSPASSDPLTSLNAELKMFEKGTQRTTEKQEDHSLDAARVCAIHLKTTLEGLCRALFGPDAQMRWVDAYFPFTHPSFELEVFYQGKWLEVLGCGVVEQRLLESAGAGAKVGWAFGLGLERLAMVLYGIPDIRLFWSRDPDFLRQFTNKRPEDDVRFIPVSVHPAIFFSLSFWLPPGCDKNMLRADLMDTARDMGRNLVEHVELMDEFTHPKTKRSSMTFKIEYRSHERVLTKDEVNEIHKSIERWLVEAYGCQIR